MPLPVTLVVKKGTKISSIKSEGDAGTVVRHPDKQLVLLRIDLHTDLSILLPFKCLHSVFK